MIGELLNWLGVNRSPASPSRQRPVPDSGRRLLIEPMEDRLLLSVTYSATVSEGGTVALTSGYRYFDSQRSLTYSATDVVDSGTLRGYFTAAGEVESLANDKWQSFDSLSTAGTGSLSFETVPGEPAPTDLTAPKNIDLAQEDFTSLPPERGMVDLAQVAYVLHNPEIRWNNSQNDAVLNLTPDAASDESRLVPDPQVADRERSADTIKSLSGSRGRLAAFDLAMQQQSTFHWRAVSANDANLNSTRNATPRSPAPTAAAPIDHPAIDAFSRLQRSSAKPAPRADGLAPSATSFVSSPVSSGAATRAIHSSHQEMPAPHAVAHLAPSPQDETRTGDAVTASAVFLDHSRAKTVTYLALAMGSIQAITYLRARPADDPEHVQLPPRKR